MTQRRIAPGLRVLKARLRDYLAARHLNDSQFARDSGLSDATIRRLVLQPAYGSTADTWRTVARTCGWSEDEVLALAGFQPPAPAQADGWTLITQGLTQYGVPIAAQESLRVWLDLFVQGQVPRRPPDPRSADS